MANRSTFPDTVDTFVELFDLPASLYNDAKRYQELKMQASLSASEQDELNGLTTELGDYIITPETWNKMADSIVNMEQFIKDEVDGYITTKQQEWATYVNDFHYIGVFDNTLTYNFQNMAKDSEGNLYLALQDVPVGAVITDTTYWQPISVKGDKGDVGLNAFLKGVYNATSTYAIGDAVIFDGSIYYCIIATTAGIDPTNATYWFLYNKMYIGATQPSIAQAGLVWIEVED